MLNPTTVLTLLFSMASHHSIWYQLVDSSTGQPYKATSATKISVSLNANVVNFRTAVQDEWDKPGYLDLTPAGALIVYKNKDVFDKRKSVGGKEEPLEEDSLVSDLGTTEDEALFVLVPLTVPSHPKSNCKVCNDPFYKHILHASESDEWIVFQEAIPSTLLKHLYIRESFTSIASSIMQEAASRNMNNQVIKVILSGTPGMGKSLFMIYLLYKLVQEGKRVLILYHPFHIYYDGQGGVFYLDKIPSSLEHDFWTQSLWCLFDTKGNRENVLNTLPYRYCNFVLSTEPDETFIYHFEKPVVDVFYIPPWSEKEMEAIASLFPHSMDVWRSRFEILGGIPRNVFEDLNRNPMKILEEACAICSLDDCVRQMRYDSFMKQNAIHSLVHITSMAPFTKCSVCYASPTALDIIVKRKDFEVKRKLWQLLSREENPLAVALCGYIFKDYALDMLEKGGSFTCRSLIPKKDVKASKQTEQKLVIPSSTRIMADRIEAIHQTPNRLYVPPSTKYPGVDAWIPGIGGFQTAIGKTHTWNDDGVEQDFMLLAGNGVNKKLYWLLHSGNYDDFTCTNAVQEGIEQYSVLIPVKYVPQ